MSAGRAGRNWHGRDHSTGAWRHAWNLDFPGLQMVGTGVCILRYPISGIGGHSCLKQVTLKIHNTPLDSTVDSWIVTSSIQPHMVGRNEADFLHSFYSNHTITPSALLFAVMSIAHCRLPTQTIKTSLEIVVLASTADCLGNPPFRYRCLLDPSWGFTKLETRIS